LAVLVVLELAKKLVHPEDPRTHRAARPSYR
jgi:hypothetical protein